MRKEAVLAALLFLSAFFIFSGGAAPAPPMDDSPETTLVCATLSVGHPSGYPFHTFAGRGFSLLPLGHAGLRLAFFAAFLASLNILVLYALARLLSLALGATIPASRLGGLLACLAMGHSQAFVSQALGPKGSLYHLALLFPLLSLFSQLAFQDWRRRALGGLFLGLGLATYWEVAALSLPLVALLSWGLGRERGMRGWALGALGLLSGLSLWAGLLMRARQSPPYNWGALETWGDLLQHAAKVFYKGGPGEIEPALGNLDYFAGFTVGEAGWAGFALMLGLLLSRAWAGRPRLAMALFMGLAVCLGGSALFLKSRLHLLHFSRLYLLLLPVWLLVVSAAGCALLISRARGRWAAMASGLALLGMLASAAPSWQAWRLDRAFYSYDLSKMLFKSLPASALYVAAYDSSYFPLMLGRELDGKRPDLAVTHSGMVGLRGMDKGQPALLRRGPATPSGNSAGRLVSGNLGAHPVATDKADPGLLPQGFRWRPWKQSWLALPEKLGGQAGKLEAHWQAWNRRGWEGRWPDFMAAIHASMVYFAWLKSASQELRASGRGAAAARLEAAAGMFFEAPFQESFPAFYKSPPFHKFSTRLGLAKKRP